MAQYVLEQQQKKQDRRATVEYVMDLISRDNPSFVDYNVIAELRDIFKHSNNNHVNQLIYSYLKSKSDNSSEWKSVFREISSEFNSAV